MRHLFRPIIALSAALLFASPVAAGPAVVAVDMVSGTVMADKDAGRRMHPASLTKLMTAYVAFAEIAAGRLRLDERLPVSSQAAGQSGSVLGMKAGETISLDRALEALVVRSGNDAAVAIAERIAGSEEAFAVRMSREAGRLGMNASHFLNATGLTVAGHVTTPRDMAVLALALRRDFPEAMRFFAAKSVSWRGHDLPTVNAFLVGYQGAIGMKTGFTCHAGYNVVAAARRNSREVVVVTMGAVSRSERDETTRHTMDRALAASLPSAPPLAGLANLGAAPPDLAGAACGGGGEGAGNAAVPAGWAVELSIAGNPQKARKEAGAALARNPRFASGRIITVARLMGAMVRWRGLAVGLAQKNAIEGCLSLRAREGQDACLVLTPEMVAGAFEMQGRLRRAMARE